MSKARQSKAKYNKAESSWVVVLDGHIVVVHMVSIVVDGNSNLWIKLEASGLEASKKPRHSKMDLEFKRN